jgi:exodeoxyribonuclease VII large subunit
MKTMARGYSIVEKDGKIVKKVNDVQKDDELSIRLSDGQITTKVL